LEKLVIQLFIGCITNMTERVASLDRKKVFKRKVKALSLKLHKLEENIKKDTMH